MYYFSDTYQRQIFEKVQRVPVPKMLNLSHEFATEDEQKF